MSRSGIVQKLWAYKAVRFICVGILNTLTDLTILNILVFAFGFKLLVANLFSASISIVLSYFWNHIIVFQRRHKRTWQLFVKFVVVTGLSIIAVQSAIIFAVEHVLTVKSIISFSHANHSQAHFIQVNGAKVAAVAAGMVWNFLLYHFVVFKDTPAAKELEDEGVVPY